MSDGPHTKCPQARLGSFGGGLAPAERDLAAKTGWHIKNYAAFVDIATDLPQNRPMDPIETLKSEILTKMSLAVAGQGTANSLVDLATAYKILVECKAAEVGLTKLLAQINTLR